MMNQDLNGIAVEECNVETPHNKSRKKKKSPESWKRNIEKKARHHPKGFPKMPTCDHRGSHNVNWMVSPQSNFSLIAVVAMIAMLSRWLLLEAPISVKKIILYFPIVGHSFIPPDRVFGNLERQFRTKSVIDNPDGYIEWQDDPKLNFYIKVFLQLDSPQPDEGTDEEDILHDLEINHEYDH
uniref:Uncharacterized protein n=1 Tax=Timema douglasi TaxID=61478 RepID=A0A7R8VS62_TIMDO|nr:unnamed protein product [Timema douglasi]